MKKLTIIILLFIFLFGISCKDNESSAEIPAMPPGEQAFTSGNTTTRHIGISRIVRQLANNAAIEAAFNLDYRPLRAEPLNDAQTLDASELSGSAAGSGQGEIAGGGIRALSEYQTVYYDPVREAARIQEIRLAQERGREGQLQSGSGEALTVIDWGPRGDYSSAIQRPSIYVIFSQPMTALESLGERSATSRLVSINPPIKGAFRWYGTSFLSFEGEEPCRAQQVYTITVAPNASSLSGNTISGERVFTFVTETLSIRNVIPGEEYRERTGFRFYNDNVPPPAAEQIGIQFNYPVTASDLNQYINIAANGISKTFSLRQDDDYKVTARLQSAVDFNTQVSVTLKRGARSRGGSRGTEADQSFSFRTPGPFNITDHSRRAGYGRYGNLVEITFSHGLNEESIQGKVSTQPVMNIGNENIEAYGNVLRIFNLPVDYGDKFKITIAAGVEDIYGRRLSSPYTCDITVPPAPPPSGSIVFPDYRSHVMLEAQFPPRYIFEYQNITNNSYYTLITDNNPLINSRNRNISNISQIPLRSEIPNTRYFELIDLSQYLNRNGRGFVYFRSNVELLTNQRQLDGTYISGTRNQTSSQVLQVTDLGLTVRYAFNKVVVLVTSLSTGNPVEGAAVKLLVNSQVELKADLSDVESYAQGITGRNGLAVINLASSVLRDNTLNANDNHRTPVVFAEKDGDRAMFAPVSHNTWRFNVQSYNPQASEEIKPIAFIFSDRGLYKPGEIITFRGVDRSNVLGMYALYNGPYTVILEENSYRPVKIASINGITTESGSFFGSINVPEDLEPGDYRLVYKRLDGQEEIDETVGVIPITVAFFERLRFQAALSSPPEAVILGDDINMTLRASYLSGGSLSGASWESAWFQEMAVFQPSGAALRGFVFGPLHAWDSKRHISSANGMLGGQGNASISQRTSSLVTGAPYYYQAEARVTDMGNQMVTAYRTVMAHPASFYIGLKQSSTGFKRAGEEFTSNYIIVNTSGGSVSGNRFFLQSGDEAGKIKVELIREEWRRVQQRGVSGYINDEYTSVQITDSVQMININNQGGTITVKPSAAGYHILRVTSKDMEGRTVLTEMNFYVTGSGGYWNMNNPTELRLVPDQDVYEPGETARILLQSSLPRGHYLITVERDGIYTEEVKFIGESVSVLEIPIARNYVPIVYVAVSSYSVRSGPPVHEYGTPDLDKPNSFFGVTRLNVNMRTRAFSVNIQTDKRVYRPGDEVTMTLTASRDGRPLPNAELSLMAVDRGVLDLINYHVPDPVEHFYNSGNFMLYASGGDSRSLLMDPVTYNIANRVGGDSGGSKIEERSDFNPTAVFEPMLVTGADGRVTHTFRLPDNLTTYRVTVFGVRGDLFALRESEIAAQNRINVRELVPRRLRERDTAEAGVLITNLDSASHSVTVRLDIGPPNTGDEQSGMAKPAGQAFVDGAFEKRVTVGSGQNSIVYFDVGAVKEGNVTLNFTVNSNILNERLVREMIIEHPYVMETVTTTGTVTGQSASEGFVIPSFADNGVGSLSLTLDATRLSLLESAVTYVFNYPYGCLEQRTSFLMPLVVFSEYLDSFNMAANIADPRRVIENEMRYWGTLQMSNGGFPYWPSGTRGDFYVSLRIAHIIGIAQSKGFNIPSSVNIRSLITYLNREFQLMSNLQNNAANFVYQSYLQSYMLYVMTLLGERIDPSRLAEILRRNNVDPSVLAFIGMAYRELGRESDAAATAQRLRNLIRMTARGVDLTDPMENQRYSYYGGKVEQLALTLQFFADQYTGDEINTRLLYTLLNNERSSAGRWVHITGLWESTAVIVRVLCAVDALIRAENLQNIDVNAKIVMGANELLQGVFRGLSAKPVTRTMEFSDPLLSRLPRDNMQQLDFTRNGTGNIYYTASLRYAIPSELQSLRDEGLGVFLTVADLNTGSEITGSTLESGKTYRANVRVSSTRDRTYLALRVPVPSGAEILDMAFVTTASYDDMRGNENEHRGSWLSHQVIMDNEIQYFWDQFNRGESNVSFLFRAVRRGVYPTPPAQAECMYESEIFGRSRGMIYTIE